MIILNSPFSTLNFLQYLCAFMILVTGGTGILGSRVLFDLVSTGKKVRAIYRSGNFSVLEKTFKINAPDNHEALLRNIEWVKADITDIVSLGDAFENITHVYHCAAIVSFYPPDYKMMMKINVEGTENMVNLALENGVKKFCHVSSIAAIGRSKEGEIITENSHWKTSPSNSGYAISKYGAEREVWRGINEGLNAVILNPGVILGPGDWNNNTPSMFKTVWKGLKVYTEGINGFVDVRDVSKAMIHLMESDIINERFILVSENISFKQFFEYIADSFNKPHATIKVNKTLSSIGWRLLKVIGFLTNTKPFITKETAMAAVSTYYYSNEKIKKAINIEFIPIKESVNDIATIFIEEKKFRIS